MSTFILKSDYGLSISENLLDAITEVDDTKLDEAESYAIEYAKGYLSSRYDVDAIFAATGINRNSVILQHCIAIALCKLHELVNARKIPTFRIDNKREAKEWFEKVQECKINPPTLPKLTGDDANKKDYILSGSNPKRQNHIQ